MILFVGSDIFDSSLKLIGAMVALDFAKTRRRSCALASSDIELLVVNEWGFSERDFERSWILLSSKDNFA
jgi:hypothetical protein